MLKTTFLDEAGVFFSGSASRQRREGEFDAFKAFKAPVEAAVKIIAITRHGNGKVVPLTTRNGPADRGR